MSEEFENKCIFIGGLRRDLDADNLKSQLKYIFKKHSNTDVTESQITIIFNTNTQNCYAFVDLQHEYTVEKVFNIISKPATRVGFYAAFSVIKDPNRPLKFDYKKTQIQTLTPTYGIPTSTLTKPAESTFQNAKRQKERCYHLNGQLGNETRTMEFKQGGFLRSKDKSILKDTIGRYVCAFLNTEGGTLLVGVGDNGQVVGVTCDQQEEDKHRLTIDRAITSVCPLVPPNLYTVQFVGILDHNNSPIRNLKVLEVKVIQDDSGEVYMYGNEAFIRRDGSVQRLKDSAVQELRGKKGGEKEKVQQKLDKHGEQLEALEEQIATATGVHQELDETKKQLQKQVATTAEVQQKLEALEKIVKSKKKSRTCSVM